MYGLLLGFQLPSRGFPPVRVFRPPPFIDKAETAIEGGSADFQEALIGARSIPSQGSLIVPETE
jgi:hypothetical protein